MTITMTNSLNRQRIRTTRWTTHLGALATAALVAVGCGGGSSGAKPDGGDGGMPDGGGGGGDATSASCPKGGSGMVKVAVVGLPDGATPMIQLRGGGMTGMMVLTVGTPVTVDAGGGYEIFYRRYKTVPETGSVVGKAYYISASDFAGCIKAGETTTATLTYTAEPGSGKMFMSVANPDTPADGKFAGFDGTAVATSGMKTPSVWKRKNFTGRAAGGAVDSAGNLWMPGGEVVNGYAMSSLAMTSDAAPEITLAQPANTSATFAAFDSTGNLWISRSGGGTSAVVRYNADDLDTSTAMADVTLTSPDLVTPAGLAFDDLGNLWVASRGNDKVVAFKAANLAASRTAADIVITTKTAASGVPIVNAPYKEPIGLAFDKAKNLWIGYISHVVKLTVDQQAASADLGGVFAIELSTGDGFAFDESGGLWTSGPGLGSPAGQHSFQRIPAAQLTAGTATPDITIDSAGLGNVDTIVINPAPTWSLIHDWM
jgi:sugar lactone lactonase YvrE